jgi:outer membrane lipoprotein LolB
MRATSQNDSKMAPDSSWHGRLALRIEPDESRAVGPAQAQSFSAGFNLTGNATVGELTLYSPLGTTMATLSWTPQTAQMQAQGETRQFESLNAMIQQATGTNIPVAGLFSWLAGENVTVPGWQADLSQFSVGRLVARRSTPLPAVELRLAVEK